MVLRSVLGLVLGAVLGGIVGFVLAIQIGTVMLMLGMTATEVDSLMWWQILAGMLVGGAIGAAWLVRRHRNGDQKKTPRPKYGRGD